MSGCSSGNCTMEDGKSMPNKDGPNSGETFITVRRLVEKQIRIPILPSDKVKDVKKKIEALEGIPVEKQTLDFAGIALMNDETELSAMGIKHDDCLHVMEKTCTRGWIQVFIKTPTETFPFGVCQQSTVMNLKKKIEEKIGMATEKQRLRFQGQLLSDFTPLASTDVKQGSVVELYPARIRKIIVKSSDSSSRSVDVEDVDTVFILKQKIFNHWHIPLSAQKLGYLDSFLDDSKMILDYGIKDDSTVLMFESRLEEGDKIWVSVMNGEKKIKLETGNHIPILALKKMLKDIEGIPVEKQLLVMNEKKLLDSVCLAEAGIDETKILQLYTKTPLNIRIFRNGKDRGTVTIDAHQYVSDLKEEIAKKYDYCSPQRMDVEFNERTLENHCMISSYEIEDNAIVRFREYRRRLLSC